jgi:hypothetical protein
MLALLRGFHPLRWLLCLAGLLLTAGLNSALSSPFRLAGEHVLQWWQDPVGQAEAVAADFQATSGLGACWAALVLAVNTALWCLPGGWIARHELLARRRRDYESDLAPRDRPPGATAFLLTKGKNLVAGCLLPVTFLFILALPLLFLIWVSGWLGALGALLMSLLLPVVFLIDLFLPLVVLGWVSWPLQPVAIAAELSDSFDSVSRSYSYLLQRPLHYLVLTAVAAGLAWLPFGGVCFLFTEGILGNGQDPPALILFLAAALSLSLFWSLETLVYLHLRLAVDRVDASELAAGPSPSDGTAPQANRPTARSSPPPAEQPPFGLTDALRLWLFGLAAMAGTWCVTIFLFAWVSSGPTDWLDGGLTGWTTPPAGGTSLLYRAASVLAALWAVCSVLFTVWMPLRRALTLRAQRQTEQETVADFFRRLGESPGDESETRRRLLNLLGHRKLGIRVQAHVHLLRLAPEGKSFGYGAWAPQKLREAAIAKWRALIDPDPVAKVEAAPAEPKDEPHPPDIV